MTPSTVFARAASEQDQAVERDFDIPAQSLTTALTLFGQQSGVQITSDGDMVRDLSTSGVRGRMSPALALQQLLAGTGLGYSVTGTGTFALRRPLSRSDDDRNTIQLGPLRVEGVVDDPAVTEGTGSYTARALTIGKGEHSLRETPQSVTVMTRQLLDDQNLNTIDEVMAKTPGITVYDSPMGGKYFYSRGFQMYGQYQYDGVPLDAGGAYVQADSFSADMSYYDRVEVLRGTAGMLKGAGTPSGAVNFVRKRGQKSSQTQISLSAGSWDNYRGQVDSGGPLNDSGTLRGRVVATGQDRNFFYDNADRRDSSLYGALDYDLSPDTTVGVGMAYEDLDASPCWSGLPRYADGSDIELSRSTCLGADWNRWQSRRLTVFSDLQHHFNDDWSLKVAGIYSKNTQDIKYAASEGTVPVGATSSASSRYSGIFDYDHVDYGIDAYFDGKFDALGQRHEAVFGINASRSRTDDFYALVTLPETQDVFNPTPHIPEPDDSYYEPNSYRGGPADTDTKQYGAYGTLRLRLADPLLLVLGGRLSWYKSVRDSYVIAWDYAEHIDAEENGEFTPFAGLIYDLNDNLSVYASYADIFQPQSNYETASGSPLKPIRGESYEVGIKGEWFGGRLNGAANLFRTEQRDVAATDYSSVCPGSSDGYCYVNFGQARAQGFEAELSGEVVTGLQILAGYTYTDTEIEKDLDPTVQGNVYNSYTPHHMLRVWADYEFGDGDLSGFSLGGGVNAQSENYRTNGSIKIVQPGYAIWSTRLGYRIGRDLDVGLNVNNIFDKRYYQSIGAPGWGNFYGEPRNAMLTVRTSF